MSLKANILLAMFRIGRDVEAHLAQLRQEGNHEEEGAAGEACPLPADVLLSAASRHVKALVGAFNQEKALVGAFSVIVELRVIFGNLRFKL